MEERVTERVTVVVMTRDRWPDLEKTLARHEAPVVVMDNGSTDGTPDLVRQHYPDVSVVELGTNRGAVARNLGVLRSRTPYVAFADDDSWWAPGALAEAADILDAHPRLAVLAGRVLVREDNRPDPICEQMARSPLGQDDDLPGPSILGFLACGAVVRRSAFLSAGGFDDVIFFMGEEERLALDLASGGWGLAYVDHVVAHHHPSSSRDPVERSARAERNRLLTAVLRRPWPVVLRCVLVDLRSGRAGRSAVRQALARLPRALVRRRPVSWQVERTRRLLDEPRGPKVMQAVAEGPRRGSLSWRSSRRAAQVRSRSRTRSPHVGERRRREPRRRRRSA
jgi:GT2 family glycosyltransferase